jgi:hypothetical protein
VYFNDISAALLPSTFATITSRITAVKLVGHVYTVVKFVLDKAEAAFFNLTAMS